MRIHIPTPIGWLAVLLLPLISANLSGQTNPTAAPAPAPTPAEVADQSGSNTTAPVVLSPFVVNTSANVGYETPDTLSGTRIDTPLKFVGSDVQEVNQQMMSDLAAFNINNVIDFTTNAVSYDDGRAGAITDTVGNASITGSFQAVIRGAVVTTPTRDFMTTRVGDDAYDLDGFSIDRGPNAILFGIGAAQGIVNATSTWAKMTDTYELGLRFDNWGSTRETFKLNRQIIPGKVAIVLAGLNEDARNNLYPSDKQSDRLYGAITITPFKNTTIRANFEHGHIVNLAARPWPVTDGLSAWEAAGSNEIPSALQDGGVEFASSYTLTSAQTAQKAALTAEMSALGFQVSYRGTVTNPVGVFNSNGYGPMPWLNDYGMIVTRYNLGVGVANVQNPSLLNSPIPYTANTLGYGNGLIQDFQNYTVVLDQAVGKHLFIEMQVNRQNTNDLVNNTQIAQDNYLLLDKNPTLLTETNQIIPNPNYDRYFTMAFNPQPPRYLYDDNNALIQAAYKIDFRDYLHSWVGDVLGHWNLFGLRERTSSNYLVYGTTPINISETALQGITPQTAAGAFPTTNAGGWSSLEWMH